MLTPEPSLSGRRRLLTQACLLPLAALAASLTAGCAKPPDYKAEPDKARAVLESVLGAWKEGRTAVDLQKQSPPVYVADERWLKGAELTSFTIHASRPFGPSTRFEVTLEGPAPLGTKNVVYMVSTQPAISVALGD